MKQIRILKALWIQMTYDENEDEEQQQQQQQLEYDNYYYDNYNGGSNDNYQIYSPREIDQ